MSLRCRFTFIEEYVQDDCPRRSGSCLPAFNHADTVAVEKRSMMQQMAELEVRVQELRSEPSQVLSSGRPKLQVDAIPASCMPNPGSYGHPQLCNRPCINFVKGMCKLAEECSFCHLPHVKFRKFDMQQRQLLANSSKIHFVGNRLAASSTTHARLWSSPSHGHCWDDWERACLSASQWRHNHRRQGAGEDFESVGINAFRCSGWGSVRQTHQRSLPKTNSRSLERAQNASLPVRKQSLSEGYICWNVDFCSAMYDGWRIFPRSNLSCQAMMWRWVARCGNMLLVDLFELYTVSWQRASLHLQQSNWAICSLRHRLQHCWVYMLFLHLESCVQSRCAFVGLFKNKQTLLWQRGSVHTSNCVYLRWWKEDVA